MKVDRAVVLLFLLQKGGWRRWGVLVGSLLTWCVWYLLSQTRPGVKKQQHQRLPFKIKYG